MWGWLPEVFMVVGDEPSTVGCEGMIIIESSVVEIGNDVGRDASIQMNHRSERYRHRSGCPYRSQKQGALLISQCWHF